MLAEWIQAMPTAEIVYPYDEIESAVFRFDNDMAGMEYTDFKKVVEFKIKDLIQHTPYDKADLVEKACGKLHVW